MSVQWMSETPCIWSKSPAHCRVHVLHLLGKKCSPDSLPDSSSEHCFEREFCSTRASRSFLEYELCLINYMFMASTRSAWPPCRAHLVRPITERALHRRQLQKQLHRGHCTGCSIAKRALCRRHHVKSTTQRVLCRGQLCTEQEGLLVWEQGDSAS